MAGILVIKRIAIPSVEILFDSTEGGLTEVHRGMVVGLLQLLRHWQQLARCPAEVQASLHVILGLPHFLNLFHFIFQKFSYL